MPSSLLLISSQRKARSEARLVSEGVPVNSNLPVIEHDGEVTCRTTEAVAWRAMALLVVAAKGEGVEQAVVDGLVSDHLLEARFTPDEVAFLEEQPPKVHSCIQFSWRYEAAWALLWALGFVEALGEPFETCDVPRAFSFMLERTPAQFVAEAKLRPLGEILDEADLIYRYHWAVVDAGINDQPAPASVNSGVVKERHYALNWLIGYMDQEWDDVTTDT